VLIVDLDPQGNATSGFGLRKTPGVSLYPALVAEQPAAEAIRPTGIPNLDLLPSEIDLAGAELELARRDGFIRRVRECLRPVVADDRYDYVFLDCSPTLGMLTMNVLAAADAVLLPIQCEYYALEGLAVIARVIRQLRENGTNPGLEIEGIVMTMYDGRTNLAREVVQEVVKHYGAKVYETLIPRNVRVAEAPSFGKPAVLHDRLCTGSVAYRQLAREFLQRRQPAEADGDRPSLGSVIRRVFDEQPEAEAAIAAAGGEHR
jgi:chromosome partitioning protein